MCTLIYSCVFHLHDRCMYQNTETFRWNSTISTKSILREKLSTKWQENLQWYLSFGSLCSSEGLSCLLMKNFRSKNSSVVQKQKNLLQIFRIPWHCFINQIHLIFLRPCSKTKWSRKVLTLTCKRERKDFFLTLYCDITNRLLSQEIFFNHGNLHKEASFLTSFSVKSYLRKFVWWVIIMTRV